MSKLALANARLVDPEAGSDEPGTLLVEDGRIEGRLPSGQAPGEGWKRVDCAGRWLAPGFLDLHFHGELVTATPDALPATLARTAAALVREGTTGFLATSLAWPPDTLEPFVGAVVEAIERGGDAEAPTSPPGARCLGLHLEGPWISGAAPGAMSRECIRPFDPQRDTEVLARAGRLLRMVTLAPEVDGAHALLDALAERDVLAAMGHTRASEAEIEAGIARGLRHVTHLFNAMGPLHHREPGVPGTALTHEALTCDLICDGYHVHPRMVRLAADALRERLVLITDRVDVPALAGAPGEPLRLPDGTLAGSQLTFDRALANARRFAGLGLVEAVAAATLRPARLLGLEHERGTLRRGALADLVQLDDAGRVVETRIEGVVVFRAEG